MGQLVDRVALITGGSRGQGEAEARLFVKEGAKVVIADVLEHEGRALAKELGENALFIPLDVGDEAQWRDAVAQTEAAFGKLDTLVNNAGILRMAPLLEMPLEEYQQVIRVNQIGTFLGMKIAGQAIVNAGGGTIVNISSIGGLTGLSGGAAYVSSKFAVTGMTKTAALELGPLGVRVNSVHPGIVDTPMVRGKADNARTAEDDLGAPLRRVGTPEDIARVVLFLSTKASDFCTGSAFTADGGAMAGIPL